MRLTVPSERRSRFDEQKQVIQMVIVGVTQMSVS